jgi:predicted RNA-binding protein with PUA-like domain
MNYWLVKQEPTSYSWDDFVRESGTAWEGVRNHEARNNLASMAKGDQVLFYHSGKEKAIVGVAQVSRSAYHDPTADEERWVAVDLKPLKSLGAPVTLEAIKQASSLKDIALVRKSRLSVVPLTSEEFKTVLSMGGSTDKGKGTSRKKSK